MTEIDTLISDALSQPPQAIGYYLTRRLHLLYPDSAVLDGQTQAFNVESYAAADLCKLHECAVPVPQRITHWIDPERGHLNRAHNALFDITWQGERLHVLIMHWPDNMSHPYHYRIIARSREITERFHAAVCEWNAPIPDEYIMVFDINGWHRDDALLAAIQSATLDTLVLRGSLKADIVQDLAGFFDGKETYDEYGIPWKRGVLFVGPPGNGKTHAVKALINGLGRRCVYIKTFQGAGPVWNGIRLVFEQARRMAPCILVLEDLDSLLTPEIRAYFLNELDGFAENEGILTLATTNHPERLDPAIVNRPSRFDRKYPFDLPGPEERFAYIAQWNASLKPDLRLDHAVLSEVAERTEGFSFAYLKELFLSAMMAWIATPIQGAMNRVMPEQVEVLREQMASVNLLVPEAEYTGPGGIPPTHQGVFRHNGPGHRPYPGEIPM